MNADTGAFPGASPDDETIAAIATPPGPGGVGVIRVSGPRAFAIGAALFRPAATDDGAPQSHLLVYGHIVDPASGELVDETLTVFMRAPRTYTREDVVEIQAHGSPLTLRRILALALAAGARLARPGEMTLRAFLNGRIDLAQAEAVMDLVNAGSEAARRLALRQFQESFRRGRRRSARRRWGRWSASKPALISRKRRSRRLTRRSCARC